MSNQQTKILDAEFRGTDQDHRHLRVWLRLLTCTNMIENELRNHLRLLFGCTLPRYDLLAQLERHPEGLSMGELSKLMMVSAGNVTGIASQLEKEGLIARQVSSSDRRSFTVKLTLIGKRKFESMEDAYENRLMDLFQCFSAADLDDLMNSLGQLKQDMRNRRSTPKLEPV